MLIMPMLIILYPYTPKIYLNFYTQILSIRLVFSGQMVVFHM